MNTKKWTVSTKLYLMTFAFLANLIVFGGISIWSANRLQSLLKRISEVQMPAMQKSMAADMMHDAINGIVLRALFNKEHKDEAGFNETLEKAKEHAKEFPLLFSELMKLPLKDETKKLITDIQPIAAEYIKLENSLLASISEEKSAETKSLLQSFDNTFKDLESKMEVLSETIETNTKNFKLLAIEQSRESEILDLLTMAFGVIFSLTMGILITRNLQNTIKKIVQDLANESKTVTDSSLELSQASSTLANSAGDQASALQETAASVHEINAMVRKTSDNSKQLEDTSKMNHKAATRGQTTISEMLNAMNSISNSNSRILSQIEAGNAKISDIVKVISEIGEKTKVINDIVFQTKLLSFNASVEAARAGEHGKGFAVVAEEVGNLAQMSGNAAKEISDMLSASIEKVQTIVTENKSQVASLIQEGTKAVEGGTQVAKQCGNALEEIVKYSNDVDNLITEMTTAIQEQGRGIEEISKALEMLDRSTHENSAMSRQTSNTSASLSGQATNLRNIVAKLQAMFMGASASGTGLNETSENTVSSLVSLKSKSAIKIKSDSHSDRDPHSEDKFAA